MYLLNLALVATGVLVQFAQRTTPWDPIAGIATMVSDLLVPFVFVALLGVAVIAVIPWPFVISLFIKESQHANPSNPSSPVSAVHRHRRICGSEAGI
jgi:hypothetical protein